VDKETRHSTATLPLPVFKDGKEGQRGSSKPGPHSTPFGAEVSSNLEISVPHLYDPRGNVVGAGWFASPPVSLAIFWHDLG